MMKAGAGSYTIGGCLTRDALRRQDSLFGHGPWALMSVLYRGKSTNTAFANVDGDFPLKALNMPAIRFVGSDEGALGAMTLALHGSLSPWLPAPQGQQGGSGVDEELHEPLGR